MLAQICSKDTPGLEKHNKNETQGSKECMAEQGEEISSNCVRKRSQRQKEAGVALWRLRWEGS